MAKSKKKAKAKDVEVLDQEQEFVPDTQPIVLAQEQSVDSDQIRQRAIEIKDSIGKQYIELCSLLWTIQKKQLFMNWGYPSFKEWVLTELQFRQTKAMYLTSIWNKVGHDQELFKKVMSVGWSKAKEIVRVIDPSNEESVNHWVDKATHMSADAICKEIRQEKRKKIPDDPSEAIKPENEEAVTGTLLAEELKTISLTFGYEDYLSAMTAVDSVRKEDAGMSITQALSAICREYLGSNPASDDNSTEAHAKAAVQTFGRLCALYGWDFTLVDASTGELMMTTMKDDYNVKAEEVEVEVHTQNSEDPLEALL